MAYGRSKTSNDARRRGGCCHASGNDQLFLSDFARAQAPARLAIFDARDLRVVELRKRGTTDEECAERRQVGLVGDDHDGRAALQQRRYDDLRWDGIDERCVDLDDAHVVESFADELRGLDRRRQRRGEDAIDDGLVEVLELRPDRTNELTAFGGQMCTVSERSAHQKNVHDAKVHFDILGCIPNNILMERINLNIPKDARKRLKQVAHRTGRTESETARALLLEALDRLEQEEFYTKVAEAQTAEIRDRQIAMLEAYEKLRG